MPDLDPDVLTLSKTLVQQIRFSMLKDGVPLAETEERVCLEISEFINQKSIALAINSEQRALSSESRLLDVTTQLADSRQQVIDIQRALAASLNTPLELP